MRIKFFEITVKDVKGQNVELSKFRGNICIIVNFSTSVGFYPLILPQLIKIAKTFDIFGAKVLIFPCTDFGNSFPNNPRNISSVVKQYCEKIEVFDVINVNGKNQHDLYKYLTNEKKGWFGKSILWNNTKFVVDHRGRVLYRFGPFEEIEYKSTLN